MAASCLQPSSQNFGYSLGVLYHVPDIAARLLIRRLPPRIPGRRRHCSLASSGGLEPAPGANGLRSGPWT